MRRLLAALVILASVTLSAQSGPALPATCTPGEFFLYTGTTPALSVQCIMATPSLWGTVFPLTKTVTGITNNVFTNIYTITVPNAASGAVIEIVLTGALGAGGRSVPMKRPRAAR